MATKLGIWNGALDELGSLPLSDTGEPGASGAILTRAYPKVVAKCLEAHSWNWAVETIKAEADTSVTPSFGFSEVFAKPADFIRTVAISADENFSFPLLQYYDDQTIWSANVSPIYVRYVSNDTGLGMDLADWPEYFARFVELSLAERVSKRLTQSDSLRESIMKDARRAKLEAQSIDAQNEPQPKFPPPGSWTLSRSSRGGRGDRGNRGSLIG